MDYEALIRNVLDGTVPAKKLGGYNHENYLCRIDGMQIIIRTPNEKKARLDYYQLPETHVLRFLQTAGFPCPKLLYDLKPDNVQVIAFADGTILNDLYGSEGELPQSVILDSADTFRTLHEIDYQPLIRDIAQSGQDGLDKMTTASFYKEIQSCYSEMFLSCLEKNAELYRKLGIDQFPVLPEKNVSFASDRLALCHCDAHRKNILAGLHGIMFLDWELAAIGDPSFDLAVHLQKMRYTDAQEVMFLQEYYQNDHYGSQEAYKRVQIYRKTETVKYALMDALRIVEDLQETQCFNQQTDQAVSRYLHKLQNVYKIWEVPCNYSLEELRRIFAEEAGLV